MKSQRKDYYWNSIAGIINAAEAVVMSMVVTRFGALSDAGVLSLAFAIGNVLLMLAKFGGRTFQVTDIEKQFSFSEYLFHRICTVGIMLLLLCALAFFVNYDGIKRNTILMISAIYAVEAIEDCIWGRLQTEGRLYLGGLMFSTRWLAILCAFSFAMYRTGDMVTALMKGLLTGGIVFLIWLIILGRDITSAFYEKGFQKERLVKERLVKLFRQTYPLFLAGFCSIFINSVPKFAIDHFMDNEVQACYGFVSMPVFVIGLLNQFIYQPKVVMLTDEYYSDNKMTEFCKIVNQQLRTVIAITAACVCGAFFIGIPALSFLYHTDLSAFQMELVILQFAGGFLALAGYFTVLLTLMRLQKVVMAGYVVALFLAVAILHIAVGVAGTVGASIGYLVVMAILFVFYFSYYRKTIMKSAEGEG